MSRSKLHNMAFDKNLNSKQNISIFINMITYKEASTCQYLRLVWYKSHSEEYLGRFGIYVWLQWEKSKTQANKNNPGLNKS